MKIGLLGGTFDPIHIGHLIIAQEVKIQLELEKIVFMPASHPWLKADREITDAKHRLAMINLAIGTNSSFEVSTAELDRLGPTYTVDTVEAMKAESDPADDIYFIVGSDVLAEFPRWKEPERVVTLCQIVQVGRPGSSNIDPAALKRLIPGVSSCLRSVDEGASIRLWDLSIPSNATMDALEVIDPNIVFVGGDNTVLYGNAVITRTATQLIGI